MKIFSLFILCITLAFSMPIETKKELKNSNALAIVAHINGKVRVLPSESIKKHTPKVGETLLAGDKVITYSDATMTLTLIDNSHVILNESSELTLLTQNEIEQHKGEVYFNIKKRAKSRGLKVKTPFSIIGIKGTEFIVKSDKNRQIALNEGRIGIESLHANFELHKKQMMDEFEAYKHKQEQTFEAYKKSTNNEIISYVKSFELEKKHIVNFENADNCNDDCESQVKQDVFTKNVKQLFKKYQQMLQE